MSIAGKAKAGMAHSNCGWTCGCAVKTVRSPEPRVPYLSAFEVMIHEEALSSICTFLTFTHTHCADNNKSKWTLTPSLAPTLTWPLSQTVTQHTWSIAFQMALFSIHACRLYNYSFGTVISVKFIYRDQMPKCYPLHIFQLAAIQLSFLKSYAKRVNLCL